MIPASKMKQQGLPNWNNKNIEQNMWNIFQDIRQRRDVDS